MDMAKWQTIASLWRPKPGKEDRYSGNGKSIDVDVIIRAGSSLVLVKNKSEKQNSPTWDLCLVIGEDDKHAESNRH
jgi:hypothetical protein